MEDLEVDPPAHQQAGRLGHGTDAHEGGRVELDDPVVDARLRGLRRAGLCGGNDGVLGGPGGDASVWFRGVASDRAKPGGSDQRGQSGGVQQMPHFQRLDPQAAVTSAVPAE